MSYHAHYDPKLRGFTLIELLIVVAIIAILAAIAVPNFLEAQTRAKISAIKADQRTLATALEAYHVDEKHYPLDYATGALLPRPRSVGGTLVGFAAVPFSQVRWALVPLTTPIAFISSIPGTTFQTRGADHGEVGFNTYSENLGSEYSTSDYLGTEGKLVPGYPGFPFFCYEANGYTQNRKWRLRDGGPDRVINNEPAATAVLYDATNGTVSGGDIVRWGP